MGSKLYNSADIKESLRHNLQKKRKEKGFKTQDAFAEALEVSVESVRNWEQGRTLPELGTLFHICSLLDCDMDYLIGRLEVPTHDLAFIKEQTRLTEAAITKLLEIAFFDRATGNSKTLSRFIENDNFKYLIALLGAEAGDTARTTTVGNANLQISNQALVRYERDSVFHDIANQMEKSIEPEKIKKIMYRFAYGWYGEGRITKEELQNIIEHYDRGDFNYIPPGFNKD